MKKSLLEVYALAVCFFAVACFTIALGFFGYAAVGFISPETTMNSWQYNKFQTNDAYWASIFALPAFQSAAPGSRPKERPAEGELTRERLQAYQVATAAEKRESFQTLLKASIVVLIDSFLFFVHWAVAKRSRVSAA